MGSMKRTISHWTGGGGRANNVDKAAYHRITEFDGNVVHGKEEIEDNIVTSDGDYAAHTRNLNTGSIGVAMAGMAGAKEYPLEFGASPINRTQFEAHCKLLAELHTAYGIPVTNRTCLTHAEVEPTLGVKQKNKWDITVLQFEPDIRGAIPVGDYMRSRVKSYMGITAEPTERYPTIQQGIKGHFVQEAQKLMASVGFFSGKKDGIFGPRTKEAVIAFQSEHGLIMDGIIGPSTWAELMRAESRPLRNVSIKDLREGGSTTIKAADNGQKAIAVGGGVTSALAALESVSGASDTLAGAEASLGTAQGLLMTYWPVLAVAAVAFVAWRMMDQVKKSRLRDAQTGRNMGR